MVQCAAGGGGCKGVVSTLLGSEQVHPQHQAIAVALDADELVVLTNHEIQRWTAPGAAPATLLTSTSLPAFGRDLAMVGGQAVIASDAGLQVATRSGSSLMLSAPVSVCGRALHIQALGESTFAVATTLGIVFGNTSGGVVSIRSVWRLNGPSDPEPGIVPQAITAVTQQACVSDDSMLSASAFGWTKRSSALAAVSATRLLAARGHLVFELDVHDIAGPVIRNTANTGAEIEYLRFEPRGQRAYGIGESGSKPRNPILDLRGEQLAVAGQHMLASWVKRADLGALSVRVLNNGKLETAKVAR